MSQQQRSSHDAQAPDHSSRHTNFFSLPTEIQLAILELVSAMEDDIIRLVCINTDIELAPIDLDHQLIMSLNNFQIRAGAIDRYHIGVIAAFEDFETLTTALLLFPDAARRWRRIGIESIGSPVVAPDEIPEDWQLQRRIALLSRMPQLRSLTWGLGRVCNAGMPEQDFDLSWIMTEIVHFLRPQIRLLTEIVLEGRVVWGEQVYRFQQASQRPRDGDAGSWSSGRAYLQPMPELGR